MKKIIVVVFTLCLVYNINAQTRYGVAEFNKKEVPAVIGDFPYEEDVTKDGLVKYFEKLGFKAKKVKDYLMYTSIVIQELGPEPHDIYIMVDRKSRQEKNSSSVTMLISKGFENFVNDEADPNLIAASRVYLGGLREVVYDHDLELQINGQEEVVRKAEKKYIGLQEDGIDLVKDKKKIEDKISRNIVDQATQKNEKERQAQILDNLRKKRRVQTQQ